jgi:addiction module HigA family antidote
VTALLIKGSEIRVPTAHYFFYQILTFCIRFNFRYASRTYWSVICGLVVVVAGVLRMAREVDWSHQHGDRGRLSLGDRYAPIHPGEHLAEELEALGMSAAELARQLKVPTNRITAILNRQRAVTGDTALRLGHFFGSSAEFWLNLQSLYELRLAEKKAWKSIKVLPTLKQRTQTHA